MIGTYKIYKDGKLLRAQKNLITDVGKRTILQYLAGLTPSWGDFVALGTSAAPVAGTDRFLGFEFTRAPVGAKMVEADTDSIRIKAEFYDPQAGWIYEMGVFPTSGSNIGNGSSTTLLSPFDPQVEPWTQGVWNQNVYRLGKESLEIQAAVSSTVLAQNSYYGTGLGEYTPADILSLAYFTQDTNGAAIVVRFNTDTNNYFQYSFAPAAGIGYHVQTFTKGDFAVTGVADWSNITSLTVGVTSGGAGGTTVQFDGLSITSLSTYADYGVTSRAVLSEPLYKEQAEEIDVEYVVQFTI